MRPLIVEQKITPLANQYRIYGRDSGGNKADLLAFAQQKRLAMREKIEFFSSESKNELAFEVQAEKVIDAHGKFIVRDANGSSIGAFRKAFASSLLRSTWEILDDKDTVRITVQERSMALAIFRRIWGFIPIIGDLPFIFKYHFDFHESAENKVVASYVKTALLYDKYNLNIADDGFDGPDWRIIAAQCVMLDALQGR